MIRYRCIDSVLTIPKNRIVTSFPRIPQDNNFTHTIFIKVIHIDQFGSCVCTRYANRASTASKYAIWVATPAAATPLRSGRLLSTNRCRSRWSWRWTDTDVECALWRQASELRFEPLTLATKQITVATAVTWQRATLLTCDSPTLQSLEISKDLVIIGQTNGQHYQDHQ